jgi:hypothetical protein
LLTGGDVRKVGLELSTASPKNGLASSLTASAAFNPDFNTFTKKLRSQSCNWEFNLFFYFGFHRNSFSVRWHSSIEAKVQPKTSWLLPSLLSLPGPTVLKRYYRYFICLNY